MGSTSQYQSIYVFYNLCLTERNQTNFIYHSSNQHVLGVQSDVDTISGVGYLDYDVAACSRYVLSAAFEAHYAWIRSWHHHGRIAHYDRKKSPRESW